VRKGIIKKVNKKVDGQRKGKPEKKQKGEVATERVGTNGKVKSKKKRNREDLSGE
jgi:hypothetical protein